MIRILIINDKEQDRNNIYSTLSTQDDFEIAGFGKDSYDALKLSTALKPDIVLVDPPEENKSKPGLVPLIKRRSPSTAVIILGADDNEDHVCKALSEGASGYMLGAVTGNELCNAVRIVYKGGCYITGGILERTFRRLVNLAHYRNIYNRFFLSVKKHVPLNFSRTELRIISCIGQGQSIKEIAEQLHLAQGTIRNCISSSMRKTGSQNHTQIALFAIQNGLVDFQDQYFPRSTPAAGISVIEKKRETEYPVARPAGLAAGKGGVAAAGRFS
ncbi:MAG: response regulator transcription factor [Treponema sp.]|jgi:two-component system response regulator DegU|nr:response regulator transcription factor [Treponema sp.]